MAGLTPSANAECVAAGNNRRFPLGFVSTKPKGCTRQLPCCMFGESMQSLQNRPLYPRNLKSGVFELFSSTEGILMMEIKDSQIARNSSALLSGRILSASLMGLLLLGGCHKQPEAPAAAPGSAAAPTPGSSEPGAASPAAVPAAAPQQAYVPPPPPPPPEPVVYTLPSGTAVTIRTSSTLNEKDNNVGDPFRGTLVHSLSSHGVVLIRAGAPVSGTVVAAKGQGKFKGEGHLGISLKAIGSYPVATSTYDKTIKGKGKRTTGFIAGGAGAGALIGGIAGGGKGALIGGLVGAGAGTAGAAYTGNKDVVIPAESTVTFTLTAPISVTVTPSAEAPTEPPAPPPQ
jgi:hypothetical protein